MRYLHWGIFLQGLVTDTQGMQEDPQLASGSYRKCNTTHSDSQVSRMEASSFSSAEGPRVRNTRIPIPDLASPRHVAFLLCVHGATFTLSLKGVCAG